MKRNKLLTCAFVLCFMFMAVPAFAADLATDTEITTEQLDANTYAVTYKITSTPTSHPIASILFNPGQSFSDDSTWAYFDLKKSVPINAKVVNAWVSCDKSKGNPAGIYDYKIKLAPFDNGNYDSNWKYATWKPNTDILIPNVAGFNAYDGWYIGFSCRNASPGDIAIASMENFKLTIEYTK